MAKMITLILCVGILLASSVTADDLYHVTVTTRIEAGNLMESGADVLHRGRNGYLVIAGEEAVNQMTAANLELHLVATSVSRDELVMDGRLDDFNVGKYPLVYQEDRFRLYRVDPGQKAALPREAQLFSVDKLRPKVDVEEDRETAPVAVQQFAEDLETLIGLVLQDSLQSYTEQLQAFNGRVVGTPSNKASRDWIAAKFDEFGYDSVVIDSFTGEYNGIPLGAENVLAYKPGVLFPDYEIVIGAHFDGVMGSPAADDNGSGTAGVLEIARVLQSIPTDLTIIFALFDDEEEGLHGSYHYADRALANGENIEYMLNMDMIGHYENSTQASLYHGFETGYTELWQTLADSLVGISGVLEGTSGGSDHYPFQQNGYEVTFVAEYIFSSVYHSYQDSTTYMDFEYMTRMVQASLATLYQVNSTAGPRPAIAFDYPAALPEILSPADPTTVQIDVSTINGGILVGGSVELNYAVDGGAYTTVPMTLVTGNVYEASMPAGDCFSTYTYYASAVEQDNGTFYDTDPSDPHESVVAEARVVAFEDNFETDQGWGTAVIGASSGGWQRGVPVDDDSWAYDPVSDGDGSGSCWLTQNTLGNTDVDGGSVRLSSPTFDFSGGGNIEYDYYLMLTNTSGGVDKLLVEINGDDGLGTWTPIASHTVNGGLYWLHHRITSDEVVGAGVELTSTMRVRFTANDGDPQSIVEAGVDGFSVSYYECEESCCGVLTGGYTGNVNGSLDGKITLSDITMLIDHVYISKAPLECPEAGNTNGSVDGLVTLSDITRLIDHVYISKGLTEPCM